jgi:hypothetical protein
MDVLKDRNASLVMADANPEGFRTLERLEAMKKAMPAVDVNTLAALQMLNAPEPKRRRTEEQPFPARGQGFRNPAPRFYDHGLTAELLRENASLRQGVERNGAMFGQQRRMGQQSSGLGGNECAYCRQAGHWKRDCPNRLGPR